MRHRGAQKQDLSDLILEALDVAAEAEQVIAAQSARIDELESLAATDELTGLNNRRSLKRALAMALDLAERHHETGVLAFLDLDGFKVVNDSHGHAAGDAMLRHVASLLTAHVRNSDIVARIGGDEFAVLLSRADPIIGVARARRLQDILNKAVFRWHDLELRPQASMGTQTFGAGDSVNGVLRNADLAMYRDKKRRLDNRTSAPKARTQSCG